MKAVRSLRLNVPQRNPGGGHRERTALPTSRIVPFSFLLKLQLWMSSADRASLGRACIFPLRPSHTLLPCLPAARPPASPLPGSFPPPLGFRLQPGVSLADNLSSAVIHSSPLLPLIPPLFPVSAIQLGIPFLLNYCTSVMCLSQTMTA